MENKKGYHDSAVIGGLDKFLSLSSTQLFNGCGDTSLLKKITRLCPPHPGYASMNVVQRKEWAQKILELLDEFEKAPSGKTPFIAEISRQPIAESSAPAPKAARKTSLRPEHTDLRTLEASVIAIKGISDVLSKKFAKLGVNTVRNLLYFFPHRHIDYSQRAYINNLAIGQENTIIANVWDAREVQLGTRRSAEATVGDETGNIRIVWFNQPYLARSIKIGSRIAVSGKVTIFGGMPVFESPEWEPYEDKELVHTGRLVPVYPLTEGLSQRQLRRLIKPAIDQLG